MSPKRLVIFTMLMVTWPYWLLLRSRFGPHFFLLLFMAWGFGYLVTWTLIRPGVIEHWQDDPQFDALHQLLPLLLDAYYASSALWVAQLAAIVLQRTGVFLGETNAPHPWFAGCFWFSRHNFAIPDIIGTVVVWFWMAGVLSNRVDEFAKLAPKIAAPMAIAFLLLAYVCFLNEHNLPFRAPAKRHKASRPTRYVARLRNPAKRSRETLGAIFSRRDPDLAKMARQ